MLISKGLFDEYEKCFQDEPAATTARCPVHVDVPKLCAALASGDFKEAYQELQKRIPFAGMFCLICDHPCQDVCVRHELDAAIQVGELERAAVRYGYTPLKKKFKSFRKGKSVAVVGGGISGLCAAFDLDRRGFTVTLYERSERLGGSVWEFVGQKLQSSDIERSLLALGELAVQPCLGETIDRQRLQQLLSENAAVFLGSGSWEEPLSIDPQTFQVSGSKLFAGGTLAGTADSVIAAVSSGKRAAVSMDRFIKGVSMTAEREREGSFTTLLPYDMSDASRAAALLPNADTYSETEAITEAARCLRCECDACLKACAHMRRYGRRPKTYAREIYTNENVFLGTRYANRMINSCTLCGLCGQRCPIGLNMAPLVAQTRRSMVASEKMPPSAHDFALRDMAFSASEQFALLRHPPKRNAAVAATTAVAVASTTAAAVASEPTAAPITTYLFYPGCQLAASEPEHVEAAYAYLREQLTEDVGLMLGCCGAPADWAGREDLLEESLNTVRHAWEHFERPTFILACSSCKDVFARKLPQISTLTLWQIISSRSLPKGAVDGESRVLSIHDACSARHDTQAHESVRAIVTELGYQIEELRYNRQDAQCCGFGGLVFYANREQEEDFAADAAASSDNALLVYCAMCKDLFTRQDKSCYHLLDLLFAPEPQNYALRRMPTLSERRDNRAALKRRLLERFWGEQQNPAPLRLPGYRLKIAPELMELMEQRLILVADVADAVAWALQSPGECFYHPENDSFLINIRKQFVTYWVEYRIVDKTVEVLSVYSHRMEIVNR
jgi:NADPH-dependent glutamate synthase beta subunit-like oxidoreductase